MFYITLAMAAESTIQTQLNINTGSISNTAIRTAAQNKYLAELIEIDNLSPTIPQAELEEFLSIAVNELPLKNKQVIDLHYFQNKSIKEIKLLIGKSESTVRNNLSYGIFFLKKYFNNKLKTHA